MALVPTNTNPQLISLNGFQVIQWVFVGLCVLAFTCRVYIRLICFRRLLFEDYLMLLALACHLGIAVIGSLFLRYIYELKSAEIGGPIGPDFPSHVVKGLRAFGTVSVLSLIGIWMIKINFLLFFYRLGHQVRAYHKFWWVAFIFNVGCGAGTLGLLQYPCMFGDFEYVFSQCTKDSAIKETFIRVVMTAVLDVASDVVILLFPGWILWTVKVSLHKKILLGAVFGLTGFTVAAPVVRGSIFGGVYKSVDESGGNEVNITWLWFWFYVEFTVSFIIACLVSFRTLFVNKQEHSKENKPAKPQHRDLANEKKRWRQERIRAFHDSILDTCRTLEGPWDSDFALLPTQSALPKPPSGRFHIDFSTVVSDPEHSGHNRV